MAPDLAQVAIGELLKSGRIRVVAEHMFIKRGKTEITRELRTLPREWFETRTGGALFWESGILNFKQDGFTTQDAPTEHRCSGIRLDPAGVHLLMPQEVPTVLEVHQRLFRVNLPMNVVERPGALTTDKNVPPTVKNVPGNVPPTITASEFDAWYAAQTPEIRAWGGAKLREKCSQDHGSRHVLKKATDHITKGRDTGRKPGLKNVPR
jgi:hypothetical protein